MRLKLTCFLFMILAIAGCKKENDRAFDKSPDERVNELLEKYQTQLEGGTNGWMGYLTTDQGANYTFYFKFNNQNRVVMYSDFTSESARIGEESSYRLKALQQVSLLFDTYSYIHVLADPDPAVAGGELGSGYNVDFEFYFDTATNDTINMVGRKHENKLKLVRATSEQAAYLADGKWGNSVFSPNVGKITNYWKIVVIGGISYQVNVNASGRTITFTWRDASGQPHSFTTSYQETLDGIILKDPLTAGSTIVTGFSNITWNATANSFTFAAGGASTTLAGTNTPVYFDRSAPGNFRAEAINSGGYWATYDGFVVNGVAGTYNLPSLTGNATYPTYRYFIYWPGYNASFDLLAPIFRNSSGLGLVYGAGMVYSQNATTGVARLTYTYILGSGHPTTGPYIQMRNQVNNSGGYYFVKTAEGIYDMVSVADSRIWITWYLQ
ncbi:DUF4302 domain-containing protein [Filimonas effusa]|uniref:DUF4302 domain-containing protein n=1 Tax=Filimonas effusa TaxID=2508721 RepID=A0A4Q1DB44_9BACT|nr:DUF4302 domain-containing protein [Filimonas effusa]RXK86500.1 DUF4302 domain-containing protein [Filimonas effusa]